MHAHLQLPFTCMNNARMKAHVHTHGRTCNTHACTHARKRAHTYSHTCHTYAHRSISIHALPWGSGTQVEQTHLHDDPVVASSAFPHPALRALCKRIRHAASLCEHPWVGRLQCWEVERVAPGAGRVCRVESRLKWCEWLRVCWSLLTQLMQERCRLQLSIQHKQPTTCST